MKDRGFSLLELLLVLALLLISFSIIGFFFSNNINSTIQLMGEVNKNIEYLSIYNQISKQFFSKCEKKNINIRVDEDRISFYTYYPVFFTGAVRCEYYVEEDRNLKKLIYEEFPYIDNKLGHSGLKKQILGTFKDIKFEAFQDNKFYSVYEDKKFPYAIRITLDNESFLIFSGR